MSEYEFKIHIIKKRIFIRVKKNKKNTSKAWAFI